jgi:hypothetical protein
LILIASLLSLDLCPLIEPCLRAFGPYLLSPTQRPPIGLRRECVSDCPHLLGANGIYSALGEDEFGSVSESLCLPRGPDASGHWVAFAILSRT